MKEDNLIGKPPVTNRGVPNTSESGLSSCLDWVQVTFKKIHFAKNISDILGLDFSLFSQSEGGLYGWKKTYETSEKEIRIFESYEWEEMGTHLIISGKGCRFFEKHSSIDWVIFFGIIQNTPINVKRIDLAVDDFKGYFTPTKLYQKIKQGCVTSQFRKGRWIESFDISDYKKNGTTLYMGSPKSSVQVRVYDKLKEREDKGFIVDENINCWVRSEIQLRDERAEGCALMIANDYGSIGSLACGILKNYMTFKIKDKNDSNKSRWKVCKWWNDYLGDVEKIGLTLHHEEPYLEKTIDWALKQWSKSMVSMFEAFDGDMDLIFKLLERGKGKMEKKDYDRIQDFKCKYGNLTFADYIEKKKKNQTLD